MNTSYDSEGEIAVDVAVMETQYRQRPTDRPLQYFEHSERVFDDVWLACLESDFATAVIVACDGGENFQPIRNFDCSYGMLRVIGRPDGDAYFHFDSDAKLETCVLLSRLVHPTSLGFEYAARVFRSGTTGRRIMPARIRGLSACAFVSDQISNWLVPDDLQSIRTLAESYFTASPPKRIVSAMWYLEAAFRSYFVEYRWPLAVTGLEALVRIADEKGPKNRFARSTEVFVTRFGQIGKQLQHAAPDEKVLREIYSKRSLLVHGLGIDQVDDETRRLYEDTELLLRAILRKALLEPSFAAIFSSDDAIRQSLPL